VKGNLGREPIAMLYRVNAGYVGADSWIQDGEIGGGRIIGEVCHFVDFLTFMNGSFPVSVNAMAMKSAGDFNDVLNVSLSYENGSIGTINYFSNGDKGLPKERCEIFANGTTAVIDDYKKVTLYASGKKKIKKLLSQDKGQRFEVSEFINAILAEKSNVIPFEDIFITSLTTFKIIESIRLGKSLKIKYFNRQD
jgi:predicted dehydrogenase